MSVKAWILYVLTCITRNTKVVPFSSRSRTATMNDFKKGHTPRKFVKNNNVRSECESFVLHSFVCRSHYMLYSKNSMRKPLCLPLPEGPPHSLDVNTSTISVLHDLWFSHISPIKNGLFFFLNKRLQCYFSSIIYNHHLKDCNFRLFQLTSNLWFAIGEVSFTKDSQHLW